MAKVHLAPSSLPLRKGETAENTKGIRTSSGMFMSASEDKTGTLDLIEEKIARATMIPRTHGEIASFLLYLSDVEEGGETMFPFENGLNFANYDFQKCVGLKVKPRKGDGLLFYSVFPNGTIDMGRQSWIVLLELLSSENQKSSFKKLLQEYTKNLP